MIAKCTSILCKEVIRFEPAASRQIAFPRGATHGSGYAGNTALKAIYDYLHWDRCTGWGREPAATRTACRYCHEVCIEKAEDGM